MKDVIFLGDSLQNLRLFSTDAKQDVGKQLDTVQRGNEPVDWKPMTSVGRGVKEIRTKVADGIYRTIYIATLPNTVYVLHAFQKKTQKTRKKDIDLAAKRLADLLRTQT